MSQQACIGCGNYADLFCARCNVTPYCSEQCQRRDWHVRHKSVCHNLMRLSSSKMAATDDSVEDKVEEKIPAPAQLRRPRSPNANRGQPRDQQRDQYRDRAQPANFNKDKGAQSGEQRDRNQINYNNNKARFVPPNHHPAQNKPRNNNNNNNTYNNNRGNNQDGRRQQNRQQDDSAEDEEWGTPAPKVPEPSPKAVEPAKVATSPKVDVQPSLKDIKLETYKNSRMAANLPGAQTVDKPQLDLVPSQYIIEKLSIGDTFLLSVDHLASTCATSQPGFVCLAMHAQFEQQYTMLLEDIFLNELPYDPEPGSTFAYLDPADSGWYRARALSRSRASLLDSGRVVPLPALTRTLAAACTDIPEFCCVLNANVELNLSVKCTIQSKTGDIYKVSICTADEEPIGEGTVTRWLPEVELPVAKQPISSTPQKVETATEKVTPPPAQLKQPFQKQDIPNHVFQRQDNARQVPQKQGNSRPVPQKQDNSRTSPQKQEPQPQTQNVPAKPVIPVVPRPDIINNAKYVMLHATSLARVCVRKFDTVEEFEAILQDAALYGIQKAKQVSETPKIGQLVLSLFDGVHYRALVKRTKAADNRYMIEYVEYGNDEVVPIEKLYNCPPELDLSSRPAQASVVALSDTLTAAIEGAALEYIDNIKEIEELVATIPNGQKSAPSGSLIKLALAKNKEIINKKLEDMLMPEWKKLENAGKDVIETKVMLFPDMETLPLPTKGPFTVCVSEFSHIERGVVCGYVQGSPVAAEVLGPLTDKINEYANSDLCKEPYLPMVEEICITQLPPYPQWFRAVVIEHTAGASEAAVLFIDYGNVENVPVVGLRKCMPDLCDAPALAATIDIKGWPNPATNEQLMKALQYLNINDEGQGELKVTSCRRIQEDLTYEVEAPELIAAISE